MMNDYSNASHSSVNDDAYEQVLLLHAQEASDFAQYDHAMYEDYCDDDQQQEYDDDPSYYSDDYEDDDAMAWDGSDYNQDGQDEKSHDDSALLRLILGVQMYLGETNVSGTKDDTPLMELQYKMYTYMKQRALELGMDTSSLC
ncbi:hypothetical protein [Absidia glauca]|uniref:Uncharacterized protein n=1 Tax=Absidia glauca TaxID=4829 RepID=A0A168SLF6_ABSGL|nr:hypothetical protein [Absidia glauca]